MVIAGVPAEQSGCRSRACYYYYYIVIASLPAGEYFQHENNNITIIRLHYNIISVLIMRSVTSFPRRFSVHYYGRHNVAAHGLVLSSFLGGAAPWWPIIAPWILKEEIKRKPKRARATFTFWLVIPDIRIERFVVVVVVVVVGLVWPDNFFSHIITINTSFTTRLPHQEVCA